MEINNDCPLGPPPIYSEDAVQLARQVRAMRQAQKDYFRTPRDGRLLEACKRMERDLDQAVDNVLNSQQSLF